jgi:acylphosphatase
VTGKLPEGQVIRSRVVVTGRVQGVFFRDTCRREAVQRGVAGWVRNRPDGTVEAVFEGPPAEVAAMVEWAAEGTPQSAVDDVRANAEPPEGLEGFAVH